jgi:cephalosporin hydroxylase
MSNFLIVDGIMAAQTTETAIVFKNVIHEFDTIIEIGFHRGGFSKWLFNHKNINTKLICYDITFDHKQTNDNIDFRLGNCFDPNIIQDISNIIKNSGKTLILCDGGNKEKEFHLYATHIKSGDVIMTHDYAHSNDDFINITNNIKWYAQAESSFVNIQQCVIDNNLIPYHYIDFTNILWGAFEKL